MSLAEGTTTTGSQPALQPAPAISKMTERFDDDATPRNLSSEHLGAEVQTEPKKDGKKKRSLFGFGKKKEDSSASNKSLNPTAPRTSNPSLLSREASKMSSATRSTPMRRASWARSRR